MNAAGVLVIAWLLSYSRNDMVAQIPRTAALGKSIRRHAHASAAKAGTARCELTQT
jgi:hypothetical protein